MDVYQPHNVLHTQLRSRCTRCMRMQNVIWLVNVHCHCLRFMRVTHSFIWMARAAFRRGLGCARSAPVQRGQIGSRFCAPKRALHHLSWKRILYRRAMETHSPKHVTMVGVGRLLRLRCVTMLFWLNIRQLITASK